MQADQAPGRLHHVTCPRAGGQAVSPGEPCPALLDTDRVHRARLGGLSDILGSVLVYGWLDHDLGPATTGAGPAIGLLCDLGHSPTHVCAM